MSVTISVEPGAAVTVDDGAVVIRVSPELTIRLDLDSRQLTHLARAIEQKNAKLAADALETVGARRLGPGDRVLTSAGTKEIRSVGWTRDGWLALHWVDGGDVLVHPESALRRYVVRPRPVAA